MPHRAVLNDSVQIQEAQTEAPIALKNDGRDRKGLLFEQSFRDFGIPDCLIKRLDVPPITNAKFPLKVCRR